MTVHQCPKCELRFSYKTEVDDHCWHDHPEFRHEYPARRVEEPIAQPAMVTEPVTEPVAEPVADTGHERHGHFGPGAFGQWLQPSRPRPRRS